MSSVIDEFTVIQAVSQQVTGDLPDGDVVILNLKDGVYFGLNEVGGRIWCLIQEPLTVRQIHEALLDEYDVDPDACYKDIVALLSQLHVHDLIRIQREKIKTG